jgi:hypothetical protein
MLVKHIVCVCVCKMRLDNVGMSKCEHERMRKKHTILRKHKSAIITSPRSKATLKNANKITHHHCTRTYHNLLS